MKKVTLNQFLEAQPFPERVARAVMRQVGGWSAFREMAPDVTRGGADAGFSGFTYYSDTVPFAERHRADILRHLQAHCLDAGHVSVSECMQDWRCLVGVEIEAALLFGKDFEPDYVQVMNALAWYVLEECARCYVDLVEEG